MDGTDSTRKNVPLYRLGSTAAGVELIQTVLRERKLLSGGVSGFFCEETEKAVKSFQKANGVDDDGVVDAETWKLLFGPEKDQACTFGEVLKRELYEIRLSRAMRLKTRDGPSGEDKTSERPHDAQLMGLAFSGGGIRSATFNLGVLQALAELKLLRRIDYLSTVSGGGYIGSWLTAWTRREQSILGVEGSLSPKPSENAWQQETPLDDSFMSKEPAAVKFLRWYSNYITPKTGLFSVDTWSVVSIYTRNLVLNLTILIAAFIALLLAPRLLVRAFQDHVSSPGWVLGLAAALLLVSLGFIALNLNNGQTSRTKPGYPVYTQQVYIQFAIICPAVVATLLLSYVPCCSPGVWESSVWVWAAGGSLVYFGLWLLGCVEGRFLEWLFSGLGAAGPAAAQEEARPEPSAAADGASKAELTTAITLSALLVGAAGGLLLRGLYQILGMWRETMYPAHYMAALMTWGPPLIILLFSLVITLHIGLMGRRLPEQLREWWSRLGGWLLIILIVWVGWFGIAIYGPVVVGWLREASWAKIGLTSGWLASTIAGVLAGKSPLTGAPGSNPWLERTAKVAPYIFVIGLFLGLSHLTATALNGIMVPSASPQPKELAAWLQGIDAVSGYLFLMEWIKSYNPLLLLFIPCVLLTALFAWRVDINQFSIHLLYRNRLTRCYLGASNRKRRANPFTGFDPRDDIPLSDLTLTRWAPGGTPYYGPYLIANTALNMVTGKELAWQERKAASFVLTPQFCGFELPIKDLSAPDEDDGTAPKGKGCYRSTADYAANDGGISLGTAMAISGAAVSPNMGYHSSPPLAFLMTVFNIRLGWWLGNPQIDKLTPPLSSDGKDGGAAPGGALRRLFPRAFVPVWKSAGPRFGLFCLLAELFGNTGDRSRFVYLSDGGHFDNLGLYELVRRRCRYIVACDATQDENLACDDLGNAIRKCYADFGIEIEIDVAPIRAIGENKHSRWHCAVGAIHYERVDEDAAPGVLVYLKSSLTGDEATDLLSYDAREAAFPHQSTADQWFDESQFESYRKLGYHVAKTTFGEPVSAVIEKQKTGAFAWECRGEEASVPDAEALFHALRQYWYPPSPAVQEAFSRHGKTLEDIFDKLRNSESLKFLIAQMYPEWEDLAAGTVGEPEIEPWLPRSADEMRAGFYLCNSMIQLMENVYLDLRLERDFDHPDNRGWMNLFKHWSWSGMFRATWAVSACTYGARFQTFCRRHLSLSIGHVQARPLEGEKTDGRPLTVSVAMQALEKKALNFLEAELIADFCRENCKVRDDLTIWIMEIVVLDATIKPGQADVDPSSSFRFTFGFALVDDGGQIVYFRVQDHLRKMGLARKGLRAIVRLVLDAGKRPGIDLQTLPPDAREVPTEADKKRFRKLYKSVCFELQGR